MAKRNPKNFCALRILAITRVARQGELDRQPAIGGAGATAFPSTGSVGSGRVLNSFDVGIVVAFLANVCGAH